MVIAALKEDGLRGGEQVLTVRPAERARLRRDCRRGAPPLRDAVHRGCVTLALTLAKTVL